jgi:hypothetical protein
MYHDHDSEEDEFYEDFEDDEFLELHECCTKKPVSTNPKKVKKLKPCAHPKTLDTLIDAHSHLHCDPSFWSLYNGGHIRIRNLVLCSSHPGRDFSLKNSHPQANGQ